MSWFRRTAVRSRWDGRTGRPRSANAASSFHLTWDAPQGEWVGAEVVLEVTEGPTVPALYFWALQVSFAQRGRSGGGAHLGLQWYPPHPGSTAVNWGGYGPDGRELSGSVSALPSATGNVNTRDHEWEVGNPYRLVIARMDDRRDGELCAWRGGITDLVSGAHTIVRELYVRGSTIQAPVVWSEIFADCDAPSASVRWSDPTLISVDGNRVPISAARVNYQALRDGGCATTNSTTDGRAFVQTSGTTRHTPQGSELVLE